LELTGLVGIILALLQLNLQQRQFAYELSQKPLLEYSYQLAFSESDEKVISESVNQLAEEYYDRLYREAQASPDSNYLIIAESILPISLTVPVQPLSLEVVIHNKGIASATKVRVILEMDRPITFLDVQSLEPYDVVEGELGETAMIVEVDRMVANDTVIMTFGSERVESDSQSAKIVLVKDSSPWLSSYQQLSFWTQSGEAGQGWPSFSMPLNLLSIKTPFPRIEYVSAQSPEISIVVTANEGTATRMTISTPTP
jgi:hypothetical protein